MTAADTSKLFVTEHQIKDAGKFGQFFGEVLAPMKNVSVFDAMNHPKFGGNHCLLTVASGDMSKAICLWRSPSGNLTPAQYQAHVDQFTTAESVSDFVTNVVHPIPAMFGGANMTFENYCKDILCAADGKPAFGPSIQGKAVFFVCHRNIRKAEWDQLMGPLFGAVAAGDGTAAGISKAMGVPEGCTCLANIPSTDESAFCMWSMPVGSTEEEFQTMIDGFAKPCTNEVFQVDTNISSGLRSFHPDVFAAELYAGAKAMIAGSGK
jgi:hypothetical protein